MTIRHSVNGREMPTGCQRGPQLFLTFPREGKEVILAHASCFYLWHLTIGEALPIALQER